MCVCVSVCVSDLRRCCLCVSVDPRWSQNSTEHISPLGVFTHTFIHTQIFSVILLTVGSPEPPAHSAAARFLLHWNSQMNSYGSPERPVITSLVISTPGLKKKERKEEKKKTKHNSQAGTEFLQKVQQLEYLWVSFAR